MNFRFPHSLETVPAAVQHLPDRLRRSNSRTRLIVIGLAIIAALALIWFLVDLFSGSSAKKKQPPPPVQLAVAQRADVTAVERALGTVLANSTVQVTARVDGQMMSAAFKEGDIVHAGDLIFRLDPRPFQAALEQAQAILAKDQAQLVSAQNDQRRYAALLAQGAASQQQRDQADATAKGMVATVQSDHAAVDVAKLNLSYTFIRSPINGKTGPILIQPGNLVTANATSPLVTITEIQPVKISLFLPQNDLPQIQTQMTAGRLKMVVPMPGAPGGSETAKVDFVGNAVSAQTGTIELRATFPNTDLRLVPGQMTDVGVTTKDLRGAIIVPRNAVNLGPDMAFVYVLGAQSKVSMRTVTVLNDDGTNEAVSGKVQPGDRVVVEGQMRIVDGSTVIIDKHHTPPAPREPIGAQ